MQNLIKSERANADNDSLHLVDCKKSRDVYLQFQEAKRVLDRHIGNLPDPIKININNCMRAANEALHTFPEGILIKKLEEQDEQLKEQLNSLLEKERYVNFNEFQGALQYYLYKRLQLARVRQEETRQEDKQTIDAVNYICRNFDTPGGIRLAAMSEGDQKKRSAMIMSVITDLGDKHGYIVRTERSFFSTTRHIVQFQNGTYSSESSRDLAMTVKARGHNDFEFSLGSLNNGALIFRQSVVAMLSVGVRDITFSAELRHKLYNSMLVNIAELERLERLCSASRFAYYHNGVNSVFDKKGDFQLNSTHQLAVDHQVHTFFALSDSEDRFDYLKILFPVYNENQYYQLILEIESRFPGRCIDGVSPKEYFANNLYWIWSRSVFLNCYEIYYKITIFNKDTTSFEQRKSIYLATDDVSTLKSLASSDKLSLNDRKMLIMTIFECFEIIKDDQNLQAHLYLSNILKEEEIQKFLDKSLPLFENIFVIQNDMIHYINTAEVCFLLLIELRNKSYDEFCSPSNCYKSSLFFKFYNTRLLFDALESKLLPYIFNELSDRHVKQVGFIDEAEYKIKLSIQRKSTVEQYLHYSFMGKNADMAPSAVWFVYNLNPDLQRSRWTAFVRSKNHAMQSLIVRKFIHLRSTVCSEVSTEYLKKYLAPLIQQLTSPDAKKLGAKLKEDFVEDNKMGCNKQENVAIDMVVEMLSETTIQELLNPRSLFKAYYSGRILAKDKADALLKRIRFLLSERQSSTYAVWMFNRSFDAEIKVLLFTNTIPTVDSPAVINVLKNDPEIKKESDEYIYIQRIEQICLCDSGNVKKDYVAKLFSAAPVSDDRSSNSGSALGSAEQHLINSSSVEEEFILL